MFELLICSADWLRGILHIMTYECWGMGDRFYQKFCKSLAFTHLVVIEKYEICFYEL